MINHWNRITLSSRATIREAMQTLTDAGLRIVLIVDKEDCLIGTVTDGDIRRGLLKGGHLEETIAQIMNKDPVFVPPGLSKSEMHSILLSSGVLALPIVDDHKHILGLEILSEVHKDEKLDVPVLIMAGGFGKRLGDLTKNLPKPMLPLGSKPILEHIVDNFIYHGFKNFFISTHYKAEEIKKFFKDGKDKGVEIEYLDEDTPLGTAGCLYFLKEKVSDIFIVINGDLFVDFDFNLLIDFHRKNNAVVTMCVRKSNFHVPYGVVEIEKMQVKNIIEKPHYSHDVSAGIYCFSSDALKYLTKIQPIDMPDLFQEIIQKNQKVLAFPLHEYWMDIGNSDNLTKVRQEYSKI